MNNRRHALAPDAPTGTNTVTSASALNARSGIAELTLDVVHGTRAAVGPWLRRVAGAQCGKVPNTRNRMFKTPICTSSRRFGDQARPSRKT